jgi:hypothetical protein
MKKLIVLLLSLAMLAGCATSGAEINGVTLTAARTGSKVLLTLRNDSASPVGYNLCSSALQRGPAWEPVETGDVCTMEIRTLQPGDSATFEKTLPSDLPAGEYRYVTNIDGEATRFVVGSNPFRVE